MHLCGNSITDLTHLFCDVLSHFHLCPCSLNAQCCIKHQISILSSPAATVFFTKISSFLTKSMTWSECDLSRVEHCVGLLIQCTYVCMYVLSSFHHLSTHILFWPARITALLLCRLIVQLLASGAASMLVRKKVKDGSSCSDSSIHAPMRLQHGELLLLLRLIIFYYQIRVPELPSLLSGVSCLYNKMRVKKLIPK